MARKVVILENEPLLMRALVRALSRLELTLFQAQSVEESRALLQMHPDVSVLVTDYYLNAGQTSEELLGWTRQNLPCCRCILMSGQEARALNLHEALYDLFIPKPFSIIEFRQSVSEQVQGAEDHTARAGLLS